MAETDTEVKYRDWRNLFNKLESQVDNIQMELVFTNHKAKAERTYDVAIRIYVETPRDSQDILKLIDFSVENNLHLKSHYAETTTRYIELKQMKTLVVELVK